MLIWVAMLTGRLDLPTAFDPVSWHAHEFLFGYLGAVIAGFMMTAVPNWTGRMPIAGWPLAGLFAIWVMGRLAVGMSQMMAPSMVALIDLSFAISLAVAMVREIVTGRNWRNLIVVGLLGAFILPNAIFHWEAATGAFPAQGYGLRLGVGSAILLIALIGGRIVPSFTRHWLERRGVTRLPAPPMQALDRVALLALVVALLLWVSCPLHWMSGIALLFAGVLHVLRLSRWCGTQTVREPLVWILHGAYLFVPFGAFAEGISLLWPQVVGTAPALHVWTAGAIGMMTMAVMTRATLGHTGRPLIASAGTQANYLCLIAAVVLRALAGIVPEWAGSLNGLSGLWWVLAYGGFCLFYGPLLLRPRSKG